MQPASRQYKTTLKQPLRNVGYIKASVGVINAKAQMAVNYKDPRNDYAWFSNVDGLINEEAVKKPYATCEEYYSCVDGSMYFLPTEAEEQITRPHNPFDGIGGWVIFNQNVVTTDFLGIFYVRFDSHVAFDIKGLTIDFGSCYPTKVRIVSDNVDKVFDNNSNLFVIQEVFNGTTFINVIPLEMVGGRDRLRIHRFTCGISNVFGNTEVIDFFFKDYAASLSDTLPSHDMTLTVNNRDLYYSPDNPDSTLAFLEEGQSVDVAFGYDIGGSVEWINPIHAYLKTWSANESDAKFNAVDIFDFVLSGTYSRGLYRQNGISLYDLAVDVFTDGHLESESYFIDPYLNEVIVHNPLPVTSQANCIQIIANAGRCAILLDRGNRIRLKAQFLPSGTLTVNNKTEYSNIDNLLNGASKEAYAEASNDFSIVDGSLLFASNPWKTTLGYISESSYHNGAWNGDVPKITVDYDIAWAFAGFSIAFRNIAPQEFTVTYFLDNYQVGEETVKNPDVYYIHDTQSPETNRIVFTFTKGSENARIFIDNIIINDTEDYRILRDLDLVENSPIAIRQNKIKSIGVKKYVYSRVIERVGATSGSQYFQHGVNDVSVSFNNAYYELGATVTTTPPNMASVQVINARPYSATLRFNVSTPRDEVLYDGYARITEETEVSAYIAQPSYAYSAVIEEGVGSIQITSSDDTHVEAKILPPPNTIIAQGIMSYPDDSTVISIPVMYGAESMSISYVTIPPDSATATVSMTSRTDADIVITPNVPMTKFTAKIPIPATSTDKTVTIEIPSIGDYSYLFEAQNYRPRGEITTAFIKVDVLGAGYPVALPADLRIHDYNSSKIYIKADLQAGTLSQDVNVEMLYYKPFDLMYTVRADAFNVHYQIRGKKKVLADYSVTGVSTKVLAQNNVDLEVGTTEFRAEIPKPSYQYTVAITEGTATAEIIGSSSYYVDIRFTSSIKQTVSFAVHGYEYVLSETTDNIVFRENGDEIVWENPLVSTSEHAKQIEEWLESYYLGDVEYNFDWRGDPRIDANDLMHLELKDIGQNARSDALIRAYQSELRFTGSWRGNIKARKAVLE